MGCQFCRGQRVNLSSHPNFRPPDAPPDVTIRSIVDYTLRYAANLVSPPQLEDEDDEIECIDVAAELRLSTDDVLRALDAVRLGA